MELISYGITAGGNFAYRLTRYFGVLAPAATFRPWIVPDGVTTIAPPAFMPPHPGCPGEAGTPVTGAAQTNTKQEAEELFLGSINDASVRAGRSLLSPLWRKDESHVPNKSAVGN